MAGSKSRGIGDGAAVTKFARRAPAGATPPREANEARTVPASTPPAGGSIVAALRRDGGRAADTVLMLAPDDIAPHPDNPRESLGDLDGLTTSIREMGVLQAVVVVPREEHLAANPRHADQIGDRPWVVVAGHRRRAAAQLAELAEMPALTRADLADPRSALRTFLAENVHRQRLEPLEEAHAYAMLTELGQSQRAVAAENGVSQAHVSKRMRLLQLPDHLQEALRTGHLSIGDALTLAEAPAADRDAAFELAQQHAWPMTTAVGHIARDRAASAAGATSARPTTKTPGDGSGDDGAGEPDGGAGGVRRPARTTARGSGGAAVPEASPSTPTDTADAGATDSDLDSGNFSAATDDADQGNRGDVAVSASAVDARAAACQQLVRTPASAARMLEDLAAAVLQGSITNDRALALTHRWLGDQIGAPSGSATDWQASVVKRDQPRLAWALGIAALHLHAAEAGHTWTSQDAHLAHQLTRTGWHPSPTELTHLQQTGTWASTTAPDTEPGHHDDQVHQEGQIA